MYIDNANGTWQSATVTANEIWQIQEGIVFVDNDSNPVTRLGIRLSVPGDTQGVQWLTAGTVYYRMPSGTKALIGILRP